jgi:chaperone modulatory protein CbpM
MSLAGRPLRQVQAELDELWLDLDMLCHAAGVDAAWVRQRADEGLLAPLPLGPGDAWRFDAAALRRVRCMRRIELHFDAVPELAALVADLEDDVGRGAAGVGYSQRAMACTSSSNSCPASAISTRPSRPRTSVIGSPLGLGSACATAGVTKPDGKA